MNATTSGVELPAAALWTGRRPATCPRAVMGLVPLLLVRHRAHRTVAHRYAVGRQTDRRSARSRRCTHRVLMVVSLYTAVRW